MPINGAYYTWEDITVYLPSGPQIDLTAIEYSGEHALEPVYGQGAVPRGVGRGNWKGEGSMKMRLEQYKELLAYLKSQNRSIFNLSPFSITVNYSNEDQEIIADQLFGCRFKKSARKIANGDKGVEVELDFICSDIEESGVN